MSDHIHRWRTRFVTIDGVDCASGMECQCGSVLDPDTIEDAINSLNTLQAIMPPEEGKPGSGGSGGQGEIQPLVVEIGQLKLERGDILGVIFKERITCEAAMRLSDEIEEGLPEGVRVMVFAEDVKLAVIKPVLDDGPVYALR